jgi:large subunit ribosomal protein L10
LNRAILTALFENNERRNMTEVIERPDSANRVAKNEVVAALARQFRESTATLLTEYRGLSVSQLKALRRSLGEGASYAITKNTLAKLAARDAGLTELDELLVGPTAIAFVTGDPVDAAKGLRNFTKENPALVIKGGVLDGKSLSADEIDKFAQLESREVLLAKLAGAMKANLSNAAALFQAPIAQVARMAAALRDKKEAEAEGV